MTIAQALKLLKEVPDARHASIGTEISWYRSRGEQIEYTVWLMRGEDERCHHTSHDLEAAVNHILSEVGVISATVEQVSQQMEEVESER